MDIFATVNQLKPLFMKRLFLLLFSAFLMTSVLYADNGTNAPELTEEQIKLLQNRLFSGPHRSILFDPQAFINLSSNTIRIEYFSEYEVELFILNSKGEIVVTDVMDSYMYEYILEAPMVSGDYLLVIQSSEMYAEGQFTIE